MRIRVAGIPLYSTAEVLNSPTSITPSLRSRCTSVNNPKSFPRFRLSILSRSASTTPGGRTPNRSESRNCLLLPSCSTIYSASSREYPSSSYSLQFTYIGFNCLSTRITPSLTFCAIRAYTSPYLAISKSSIVFSLISWTIDRTAGVPSWSTTAMFISTFITVPSFFSNSASCISCSTSPAIRCSHEWRISLATLGDSIHSNRMPFSSSFSCPTSSPIRPLAYLITPSCTSRIPPLAPSISDNCLLSNSSAFLALSLATTRSDKSLSMPSLPITFPLASFNKWASTSTNTEVPSFFRIEAS